MNVQEANILAAAMEKKLKVFSRMAEVLKVAAGADAELKKHKDTLQAVDEEIKEKREELAELKESTRLAKQQAEHEAAETKALLSELLAGQQKEIQERTVFFQHQLREAEQNYQKEADDLETFRGAAAKQKADLQGEIDELTEARDGFKEQLRKLAS